MQAEDIIQQKEWQALSETEKVIVSGLATSEQEYNLLKKILQVTQEESLIVPELSPAIKKYVQQQMQQSNASVRSVRSWYYAAAAVVLVFIGLAFLLTQKPQATFLSSTVHEIPLPQDTPTKQKENKTSPVVIANNVSKQQKLSLVAVQEPPVINNFNVPAIVPEDNYTTQVNISVKDNAPLLSLITEAY